DPSTWLKKLIEIIAHSYYLGEGVMYLLQEAMHAVYQEYGVYNRTPQSHPTFKNVLEWLEAHPVKGRKALWMDSALRGLKSICFGYMGSVVNTSVQPNLSHLLEKRVILELDSLTNADKTLIIESMLLWIHHYRLSQPDRETFKHAMIIEEAHHILLRRTGAGQGGEAITDTILREIRELGESIVLVDQHPSLISIPAMGNTYTTLCMNVKHRSDVNAAASAMLLSDEEKEILGILPVGQAVVKLQGRFLQPFQISIPHIKIPKGSVDDASLAQFMLEKNILKPCQPANHVNSPDASPESLSEWEKQLLQSVLDNPLAGTVERYKNLGVSRRKGNTIRESCIHKKLISLVEIRTRSGKLVLVELTRLGRKILREMGFSISEKPRWGGLEHEYWKKKTAEKLEKNGWSVKLEEPVNGYTDIIAEKDGGKLAVEVETGKSDWRANLQKNLQKGFQQILIIATNPEAYRKISAETHEFTRLSALRVELAQNLA
ncbi:MAG: ATP-binding protein, partial [Candidatus Babeliaceae bacterium]|nr:ATP-binding protein [Candidatus Babeliaceae bacterium]